MAYDKSNIPTNPQFKDITGHVHGRLTAIAFHGHDAYRKALWLWQCECGQSRIIRSGVVVAGQTHSCGCLAREETIARHTIHGQSAQRTPEYGVWAGMIQRGTNTDLVNYAGRGIGVCERWRDFVNFYADMGKRPTPKHTLERKDNNGDYEPDNCIWADRITQGNNRRNNVLYTFNGTTQTLRRWATQLDKPIDRLRGRLKRGWSIERAFTHP